MLNQTQTELNELTKTIISALSEGVIIYDQNFKILVFNKVAEKIFNLPAEEILGKNFSPGKIKEPNFKLLAQTLFASLAPTVVQQSEPGRYPQIADLSFEEPKLELRVTTDKLITSDGKVFGFIKIITDCTRELEILKSKSEFISIAAHQLRTPLTAVNWALETLTKESLNENQKTVLNTGFQASTLLLKIVNDLLDVSKIEEGRYGYQFERVNFADFIDKVISQIQEIAKFAGVKINFQKPAKPIEVNIDSQKLEIALFNLLDNAIRYNVKNGEVIINIEELKDKPYLQVSVKDTGIGINGDDLKKLFTKFFRAENVIKTAPTGSGLGLYIVKNIIKCHGGEIWAESEFQRGSTFYFTLPTNPKLIPQKEVVYGEDA